MDDKWFKKRQKEVGVTAEEIAAKRGRSRSNVSNILTGKQKMSLDWARAFSDVLDVPLDVVLEKAGALDARTARPLNPGFSESDVVAWQGKPEERRRLEPVAEALGAKPGIDVWDVKTSALAFMGYMPGDHVLIDTHASERVRQGDVVVAQIYDRNGSAKTVLRRYEPPVLVTSGPEDTQVHVVDGENVVIRGRAIACWRT